MTRAVHALYVVIPPAAANEKALPVTPASVIRWAVTRSEPAAAETVLYEHGTADWYARERARGGWGHVALKMQPAAVRQRSLFPAEEVHEAGVRLAESPRRRRGLDRRSPSGLQGGTVVRLDKRVYAESSLGADRGTLWHAWLEQIEWLDDGEPSNDDLLRVARRLPPTRLDLAAELAAFRKLLSGPPLRELLNRSTYSAGLAGWHPAATAVGRGTARLVVEREQRFAIREDNAVLTGAIDRLVLVCRGDTAVAADVLDFKTDQITRDKQQIAERVAWYGPQLAGYRRAVAALFGVEEAHVRLRLVFVIPGAVCEVA
jgi:ATP-dependent exoDNAse (exonuclease V) beta subunit